MMNVPTWTPEDDERSHSEGWALVQCFGNPRFPEMSFDIQKLDEVGLFESDALALRFVLDQHLVNKDSIYHSLYTRALACVAMQRLNEE